ncbi:MAG: response regulator [Eubacteriales bacterium]|nr:response regulator [Eubacteriales bacterium]
MINILMAEDEDDVRNGIEKWINESGTEFRVAATASDGKMALQRMQEVQPDILVTDICMPKMDGLELIREIRRQNSEIPIIVVSGYDEFSYAREAMRMGVREYLLKPFLPGDLLEVLQKSKAVLEEKSQLAKNMRTMNRQLEEGRRYRKERFLQLVLDGQGRDNETLGAEFGFLSGEGWYGAAVIMEEAGEQPVEPALMEQYLTLILESYLGEDIRVLGGYHGENQYVLIFGRRGQSRNRLQQDIRKSMERICIGMEQHHQIRLRCAVGRVYGEFDRLAESYQEALDLWRGKLPTGQRVMAYVELEGQGGQPDAAVEEQISGQLIGAVRRGQAAEARERLARLMEYYASFSMDQIEYISISLVKLVLQISDAAAGAGLEVQAWKNDQVLTYLKRHFTHGSLMEAKEVLETYLEKCCSQIASSRESDGGSLAEEAKVIIAQNLNNENFGLEQLAEELHFSSNYVRRLFKSGTGICFSDYLQQQRMELARELLQHTDRKIQSISEAVGYSNQQYFARSFKKYYGCTPTAFREEQEMHE